MNLITYSLYGNSNRYIEPLISNSKNLNAFYKGWSLRVYHDDSVPNSVLEILSENGVHLINILDTSFSHFAPKFWRFLPVFEDNIDVLIVRDSDSIFTFREVNLVNYWLNSKFLFHILRDHQLHISPILAGMFGIKKKFFPFFANELLKQEYLISSTLYNADQIFLANHIYKKIINSCVVHTSFFAFKDEKFIKILKAKDVNNFIGSVFIDNFKTNNSFINYDFIIGVPFWIAKLLRYKIRPVLYLSFIFHYVFNRVKLNSFF